MNYKEGVGMMSETINNFKKKKEYLICIDSDGCAMDTMDIKHKKCFGPCIVETWELDEFEEDILKRWDDINLYTMTRGINRFKGLLMMLEEINEHMRSIEGLNEYKDWVESTKELSNKSLEKILEKKDGTCLKKALEWSKNVNEKITQLEDSEKLPFEGVLEGLKAAHEVADVAIVSSANYQAIIDEWEHYNLLEHTDIVLSQDVGTKAYCISELLKCGYKKDHVIMVGDAPGDYEAAQKNGVLYYPIIVRREKSSWDKLQNESIQRFTSNTFKGEYENSLINEFLDNLKS
jgi:phosphoglycolate phosphatase-like HAD superfamily hydrolase